MMSFLDGIWSAQENRAVRKLGDLLSGRSQKLSSKV